jgi:hypothetical protein
MVRARRLANRTPRVRHGDLFLTREEAQALADVLKDEPQLEPFLSVEALPRPEPSPN